ncbi:MAG: type II CAAX endopeptidase family protein [Burkholderiaceae bacterium]
MEEVGFRNASVARLIAAAFLSVFILELLFKPISGFVALLANAPKSKIVLTIHDVIFLFVLIVVSIGSRRLREGFGTPALQGFASGVFFSAPFVAAIWLCVWASGNLATPNVTISFYRFWILAFGSALYVALAEELLLRGMLQSFLERKVSPRSTVWLQGLVFLVLHLPGYQVDLFQSAYFFAAGALLTLIFLRWRSVWITVGVHFVWNISAFVLYGFSVRGNFITGFVQQEHFGLIAVLYGGAVLLALIFLATSARTQELLGHSSVAERS